MISMKPSTTPVLVDVLTPRYTRKHTSRMPAVVKTHQRLVGNEDCSEFHSPATV